MSKLTVDTIEPSTGTTVTLGASGDTFTLPSGATLSGAGAITVPSGGSLTINSGATITNNGTSSGFGKVLQVVSATKTDTQSFAPSTSFSDVIGLSVSITPTSTSSKILIFYSINAGIGTGDSGHLHSRIMRDATPVGIGDAASNRTQGSGMAINTSQGGQTLTSSTMHLDSPATTSAITYKIQCKANNVGATGYINRSNRDADNVGYDGRATSNITVMEIAG